jgi:hypothetical protein
MGYSTRDGGNHKPESVFDWELGPEDDVQRWLEMAPFDDKGLLHLPEHSIVKEVQHQLTELANRDALNTRDVLAAYQKLSDSARDSDIVCGFTVAGKRCGGIMEEEVTPFGIYYQCRKTSTHRVVK